MKFFRKGGVARFYRIKRVSTPQEVDALALAFLGRWRWSRRL